MNDQKIDAILAKVVIPGLMLGHKQTSEEFSSWFLMGSTFESVEPCYPLTLFFTYDDDVKRWSIEYLHPYLSIQEVLDSNKISNEVLTHITETILYALVEDKREKLGVNL